jgi:hypothetical protein
MPPPAGSDALPTAAVTAAIPDIVSRSSNPLSATFSAVLPTLVRRNAASISYRGRRVTDEAFRTQKGEPIAGCPSGPQCSAPSRLWLSEAMLRALLAPRVDSCRKPSRSCPTIQVLFCVAEMWSGYAHYHVYIVIAGLWRNSDGEGAWHPGKVVATGHGPKSRGHR